MLFPAVTGFVTSVNPSKPIWSDPLLFSAFQFFTFNLGDFLSRYFPVYPSVFITSARKLAILSYARTIFVPLFLMCNVSPATRTPIINSDFIFMLLVLLFGFSNGYLSAALQICAASLEHNPKLENRRIDVDTASNVLGFALTVGLVIGGVVSFAAKSAVCGGCNPFIG
jgi:equilibrative nucleoside transporter 1/2/3